MTIQTQVRRFKARFSEACIQTAHEWLTRGMRVEENGMPFALDNVSNGCDEGDTKEKTSGESMLPVIDC